MERKRRLFWQELFWILLVTPRQSTRPTISSPGGLRSRRLWPTIWERAYSNKPGTKFGSSSYDPWRCPTSMKRRSRTRKSKARISSSQTKKEIESRSNSIPMSLLPSWQSMQRSKPPTAQVTRQCTKQRPLPPPSRQSSNLKRRRTPKWRRTTPWPTTRYCCTWSTTWSKTTQTERLLLDCSDENGKMVHEFKLCGFHIQKKPNKMQYLRQKYYSKLFYSTLI